VHPFGDFRFRRVPSKSRHGDLIVHQLKDPHDDADWDINVIFPNERLADVERGSPFRCTPQELISLWRTSQQMAFVVPPAGPQRPY
jgi:hypothetical protein